MTHRQTHKFSQLIISLSFYETLKAYFQENNQKLKKKLIKKNERKT
jgi:hypothetical protein